MSRKEEFELKKNIVLYQLTNKVEDFDVESFRFVKSYMDDNKYNTDVKDFIKILLECFKNEYDKYDYERFLPVDSTLDNLRTQTLFYELPFCRDGLFKKYYEHLITDRSVYDLVIDSSNYAWFMRRFLNFYKLNNYPLLDDEQEALLFDYLRKNRNIFDNIKDEYPNGLDDAYKKYSNALVGVFDDNYIKFRNNVINDKVCGKINDKDITREFEYFFDIKRKYLNRLIEIFGEEYAYSKILKRRNSAFTSKILGTGFGYDLYYQSYLDQVIEELIKVKTTTKIIEKDKFNLTQSEYNKMLECENKDNVNYSICRLFYVDGITNFNVAFLKLDKSGSLVTNRGTKYVFDYKDREGYHYKIDEIEKEKVLSK